MSKKIKSFLEKIEDRETEIQDSINLKLEKGLELSDDELDNYSLTEDDEEVLSILKRVVDGENVPGFDFKDFLASPSAKVLIPKVIIAAARKASEPIYLASKFFKKIRLKNGNSIIQPEFGHARAFDVAEGAEIPQIAIEWQTSKNGLLTVGKSGVRIQYSDELMNDVEFDVLGMLAAEASRALACLKEQKAFTEFSAHGHTVFDNDLYHYDPIKFANARTTGIDELGQENDTMGPDDYLDLIIALYNNGFSATNLIMHPLAWPAFYKTGVVGGLNAYFDREAKREVPAGSPKIGPESIQGRLPFAFNLDLSNFAALDKRRKTFDITAVDSNNVGVMLIKDDVKTENFRNAARDINDIKMVERYGYGVQHEGNAICQAKNISMSKSYPRPERVVVVNK